MNSSHIKGECNEVLQDSPR